MDDYYKIARTLGAIKGRNELAIELRRLHQQTVDQVIEHVLSIIGQAQAEEWTLDQIRDNVRNVEIPGTQLAHDRLHLRRCEAILHALRSRKALLVSKREVAAAFERGDGVDVNSANPSMLEISLQEGKFTGK